MKEMRAKPKRNEFRQPRNKTKGNSVSWKSLGFDSYSAYLASPLWKQIKIKVWAKYGRLCFCGNSATEIHHRNYSLDTMKGKNLAGLIPICNVCHQAISLDKKGIKRSAEDTERELLRLFAIFR